MQPGAIYVSAMVARSKRNLDDLKPRLATLDPNSDEAKSIRHRIAYDERLYKGLSDGFTPVPPSKTFNDRVTLELGHTDAALERFQRNNITAFWRQLFTLAVTIVEKTIEQSGIEAALAKYREMKSDPSEEYYFDEASFNALGYRLMRQGNIKVAIKILYFIKVK